MPAVSAEHMVVAWDVPPDAWESSQARAAAMNQEINRHTRAGWELEELVDDRRVGGGQHIDQVLTYLMVFTRDRPY